MTGRIQGLLSQLAGVSSTTPLGRLLRAPLAVLPSGLRLPVVSGPLRGAWWITGAATRGCWLGTYEARVQRLIWGSISPGDIVYDIGANVGFYTLLASRRVGTRGRVYAFEPLPRNLGLLERHLAINKLENVAVVALAVAESEGLRSFRVADHPSMGHLSPTGEITVETASIDVLLAEGRIEPPDLMKIDVEGSEDRVLEGAVHCIERHRPFVVVAVHGDSARSECANFLTARGYELGDLNGGSLARGSEIVADPGAV